MVPGDGCVITKPKQQRNNIMKRLLQKIQKLLRDRRMRRILTQLISGVAAVVVFTTTYALVLPAITMETEASCGIEAHQHSDSCYEDVLICGQEESDTHQHSASCYEKTLVCGKEVHIHSTACYHNQEEAELGSAVAADTESSTGASTGQPAVEADGQDVELIQAGEDTDDLGDAESESADDEILTDADTDLDTSADDSVALEASTVSAAVSEALSDVADENDAYVPTLDSLDFDTVLNDRTGIYYYSVADGEIVEDSAAVPAEEWNRIEKDTELGKNDLLRAYLAYSVPAGALNETNPVARYRLPANLRLTDAQVKAINENENGIAGQYIDHDSLEILDTDKYNAFLGAEAVEGDRRPDEDVDEYLNHLSRSGGEDAEYISAVVRVENVFDEQTGEYVGQDLIFTFTPYSIDKNRHEYDASGQPTKAGQKIRGWFALDFNMSQVEWEDTVADVVFVAEGENAQGGRIHEIRTRLKIADEPQEEETDEDTADDGSEDPASASTEEASSAATEDAADASTEDAAASGTEETASDTASTAADAGSADSTDEAVTADKVSTATTEDTEEEHYSAGTLTATGDGYRITLDYTADAQIPEDASLSVREITAETDPETYEACLETSRRHLADNAAGNASVDEAATRFFDIEIHKDGEKLEPKASVAVNIQLEPATEKANAPDQAGSGTPASDPTVLHFADQGVEQVESDTTADMHNDAAAAIQFEAESFSIYGVVYTVDFEYKGYMVSIPGESSILLSRLIEVLGLGEAGDVPAIDLRDVKSVVFSDDRLVRVERIEQEATVNDILTGLDEQGVETWLADNAVVRADDKSDEEVLEEAETIDQMDNEETVTGGDWILTALQPFHSEETLTIEMTDGSKYIINVTDLDTHQDGKKPDYVNDTVDTIAEGIKIVMFDYGPEKLDNVNNTYNSTDTSGINKNHTLKFYSYGTNGNTVNNFTGGAYAMQGVVRSKLVNGYPEVNDRSETLAYLFDPTVAVNGKEVKSLNANYLFRRMPQHGMELFYDSDQNYAYLDGNNFKVYNDTYLEEGADYENPFRIGFYPYNDYDNRYQCIHGNNFNWGCKGSKDWRVRDQVGHYNHHFGMTVEGKFYMTDDKMITNETTGQKEEMRFKFSGDDDMWVFIDGVLVLDIGGIHNPVDGEINFTTGQVTVSAAKTANGGSAYALGTNTTIAQAFAKAGETWDDSPLSHHDIKIFYMERGGMYSNLAITMNLPTFPEPREVDLTKVSAGTQEPLDGAQFKLYSDPACQNEVMAKDTNGVPRVVVITSKENPKGRVHVDNLVPGQKYYLKEIVPPTDHKLDNSVYVIEVPKSSETSIPVSVYKTDENGNKIGNPVDKIENTKDAYGKFDFIKVDEDTGDALANAQFTLYTDADCRTIAKDNNQHDLVATSAATANAAQNIVVGQVSFAGIPAGATYYMKETQEPEGYFPSSDVYRVVVSEDGTQVSVYKGTDTEPLFTNSGAISQRTIVNKPKTEKTTVSVEKLWSDGAANHTGDTVTVKLYRTYKDVKESGGKIKVQIDADKWLWEGDTNQEKINTAPTANGASVNYKIYKSGDANKTAVATGTLNSGNGWSSTHQLDDMADGEHIQYVIEVTGQDGNVITNASVYNPADGSVQGSDSDASGTVKHVYIQADVKEAVQSHKMTITAGNIRSKDQWNHWRISFSECALMYNQNGGNFSGYVNSSNPSWSENSFTLNDNTGIKEIELPDLSSVNASDINKYWYRIKFDAQEIAGNEDVHIVVSPGYNLKNEYSNTTLKTIYDFHGNSRDDYFYIPATAESINISFTGTYSGALNIDYSRPSLAVTAPRDMKLGTSSGLVSSGILEGEESPVYSEENVYDTRTLQDGYWAHTWYDLPISEPVTIDGVYQGTRYYHYYVKEDSVNFADSSIDPDTVQAEYSYIYNEYVYNEQTQKEEPVISSGIKQVVIKNTVPPKTSISVTKEWYEQDGTTPYVPPEGERTITFDLYQEVNGTASVYESNPPRTYQITCQYDEESDKWYWPTETINNLPTKVKVGNELKDARYYVVETSPAAGDNLITYYISDGKTYSDAADAAGASSVKIVNINSTKEIKITKKWYYKNGTSIQEVAEPEEKEIFFKLKKVDKTTGEDAGFYTATSEQMPESDVNGESVISGQASSDGTVFRIACVSSSKEVDNEYGGGTHTETTWAWNTLTFKDLPTDAKYYMVETDASGNPLIHDTENGSLEIRYEDNNGKEITQASPIDPSIPGDYTIKNIEKVTSLYAEKIWNMANKDNLAGNEPVWFSLLRIQTDGNGHYYEDTLEETPEIGRFKLLEGEGWTRYFNNIEIAPTGQKEGETYRYYQYFVVELGLLKSSADTPDDQKQYEMINNLFIEYQTKGSGTGTNPEDSDKRSSFAAYGEGVRDEFPTRTSTTVRDWINTNKTVIFNWITNPANSAKLRIRTWNPNYDGTGTLGIFNSSEDYLTKPISIVKEWKKADGTALDPAKLNEINDNESATKDKYTVEIQLVQRARNLKINSNDEAVADAGPHEAKYGSTVLLSKDEVIMQSDLFHVEKDGTDYWKYKIPPSYVNKDGVTVNQLPSKGPFTWNGTTYQAEFDYYVSEYRVYNGLGQDRTPHWTAACLIDKSEGKYSLTLENYETTDLTVHKTWDEVPTENRAYVNDNVKAVLYKVYRAPETEGDGIDETKTEDITELIGANYEAYDLTASNIYETRRTVKIEKNEHDEEVEIEVDPTTEPGNDEVRKTYYEDYVRLDQPDGGWWNESAAKDIYLKINNLDTHVRDFVTEAANGSTDGWKKYKYWIVEQEYIDGDGAEHPISTLLHGSGSDYPKYQSSTAGTAVDQPGFNGSKTADCTKIELGDANKAHLGSINTVRGNEINLLKDDETDSTRKLSGAKFILKKKNASGVFVVFDYAANVDGTAVTINKTGTDGQFEITDAEKGITITGLMPGVYELQEKKAPDGYNILGTAMQFEISEDGIMTKLPPTGKTLPEGQTDQDPRYKLTDKNTASQKKSEMIVHNTPGAELPSTGGPGTRLIYLISMLLITVAAGGFLFISKQRNVK